MQKLRINQFISRTGYCSRRKADSLIRDKKVSINQQIITDFSYKVDPNDSVYIGSKKIQLTPKVYILFHKPKNSITTTHDDRKRKTVMDYLKNISTESIFPVGRLDRNTTGLLLITNDGILAQQLMHPSFEIPKTYHLTTSMPWKEKHIQQLKKGILLEDGMFKPQKVQWNEKDPYSMNLIITDGRNRIIRRMASFFNQDIKTLKRTGYHHFILGKLPYGKYRYLNKKEIAYLYSSLNAIKT